MYDVLIWIVTGLAIWLLFSVIFYSIGNCDIFRQAQWKSFKLLSGIIVIVSIVMVVEKFFG